MSTFEPKGYTIVDTNGKVLKIGNQGVRIMSEDGVHLFDLGEASDDTVVNVFIHTAENIEISDSDNGELEILHCRVK